MWTGRMPRIVRASMVLPVPGGGSQSPLGNRLAGELAEIDFGRGLRPSWQAVGSGPFHIYQQGTAAGMVNDTLRIFCHAPTIQTSRFKKNARAQN
jgi:hypothetical protein